MKYLKDLKKSSPEDATNKTYLILALIFLSASIIVTVDTGEETDFTADSVNVIDGDTLEASQNSSTVTVRLLGVDTPETQMENNPAEYGMEDSSETTNCLNEWGEKAKEFAKGFTTGNVSISTDPASRKYGDYNRLLAYVETDNGTLNEALIKKGYARVYESDFGQVEKYIELESEAREKDRGLWTCN